MIARFRWWVIRLLAPSSFVVVPWVRWEEICDEWADFADYCGRSGMLMHRYHWRRRLRDAAYLFAGLLASGHQDGPE